MSAPSILPYGPGALLVETGELSPIEAATRCEDLPGVLDVVPGAGTVLITYRPTGVSEADAAAHLTAQVRAALRDPGRPPRAAAPEVRIQVRYDGADLARVAELAHLSVEEVIARHTGRTYRVAFMGFAPGFGYLEGLDERLHLPRLDSPRTSVPAGSVAIAGGYSAVYPTSSPGGWLLLGRAQARLFDPSADPPALLSPGCVVRFEPT